MNDKHQQTRRRLDEARDRALELMDELGRQELGQPMQDLGWTFAFDHAKRRLGCCRGEKKVISLSRYFVALNGLEQVDEDGLRVVEDVMRHEIAHAIDYETRGRSDHGPEWKAVCRRVGADPSRAYEGGGVTQVPGKYVARCQNCGAEHQYYRRPTKPRACGACCREHSDGQYDERFVMEIWQRY